MVALPILGGTAAHYRACSPSGSVTGLAPQAAPEAVQTHTGFSGYTMQEDASVTGSSPGGPKIDTINTVPHELKDLSWMGDAKTSGDGATYTGSASNDLIFGQLSVSAESKAVSGGSDAPATGASLDEARWTDAVFLRSADAAGTLEPFTLKLVVANPTILDGGNGQTHTASLQAGALVEDIAGTTYGIYFARFLNTSGTDEGHPGVNQLTVMLPVGTSILLTGVVDASAGTTAAGNGRKAYADAEVDNAHVCLTPPHGVSLIAASGTIYRRC